jgi:hypothetical protein
MVKNLTLLIVLPLLLFLEVGIAPVHNFLPGDDALGSPSARTGISQGDLSLPNACPVCRFLQISFLLSIVLFFSSFRQRREKVSVREISFPAQPRNIFPSRGPPSY